MRVGLVLEGGAMRGIYTAGVIDTLMKENILVDGIIGVSAGALFGMNYKSKQIGRVKRYNENYIKDKNYFGINSYLKTGNVMNEEFCFHKLINELDPVDFDEFKNNKVEFYVVVTNIESGNAEYIKINDLRNKDELEYLRASGSMPFFSKIVNINNKKYLDGAIGDSIPLKKMKELGFDKLIVVLTRPKGYKKKKKLFKFGKFYYKDYPLFVKKINERYKNYNNEINYIEKEYKNNNIVVIRPSRLIKIKRIEKNIDKINEMYDLGVNDTLSMLEEIKVYLNK